jgi:hypothetical protein
MALKPEQNAKDDKRLASHLHDEPPLAGPHEHPGPDGYTGPYGRTGPYNRPDGRTGPYGVTGTTGPVRPADKPWFNEADEHPPRSYPSPPF